MFKGGIKAQSLMAQGFYGSQPLRVLPMGLEVINPNRNSQELRGLLACNSNTRETNSLPYPLKTLKVIKSKG